MAVEFEIQDNFLAIYSVQNERANEKPRSCNQCYCYKAVNAVSRRSHTQSLYPLGYISLAFSSCCLFDNSMRDVILSFTHCSYVCGWWWCCCCRRRRRRRQPSTYPMPFVIAHSMCVSNDMYTCDARHRQRTARCRLLCHSEIHGFVCGFGYCLLLLNVLYRDFLQLFFPHFITTHVWELRNHIKTNSQRGTKSGGTHTHTHTFFRFALIFLVLPVCCLLIRVPQQNNLTFHDGFRERIPKSNIQLEDVTCVWWFEYFGFSLWIQRQTAKKHGVWILCENCVEIVWISLLFDKHDGNRYFYKKNPYLRNVFVWTRNFLILSKSKRKLW